MPSNLQLTQAERDEIINKARTQDFLYWLKSHEELSIAQYNGDRVLEWLELRKLPMTRQNFEAAYDDLWPQKRLAPDISSRWWQGLPADEQKAWFEAWGIWGQDVPPEWHGARGKVLPTPPQEQDIETEKRRTRFDLLSADAKRDEMRYPEWRKKWGFA